jgi:hypothetical protein
MLYNKFRFFLGTLAQFKKNGTLIHAKELYQLTLMILKYPKKQK